MGENCNCHAATGGQRGGRFAARFGNAHSQGCAGACSGCQRAAEEREELSMAHKKLVTAVFRDRYDAERAFDYLHAKGYMDSEINVLMSDRTRSTFYPLSNKEEDKHKAGTMAPMAVPSAPPTPMPSVA